MDGSVLDLGQQLDLLDVAQASRINLKMEDLADFFSQYSLSEDQSPLRCDMGPKNKHHQLVVEFPCFYLLPSNAKLALEPPCNIPHREKPKKKRFFEHNHPEAIVRLQTYSSVADATIPPFAKNDQLESMVERLTLVPGFSTLKVVSYTMHGASQVLYRFQLVTTWVTVESSVLFANESQNFFATADEWASICSQSANVQWVKLLETHINRATDFSYIRVQERMKRYDARLAQRELTEHEQLWDTQPLQSANHVLKLRLKKIKTLHLDSAQNLYELPCGHQYMCNDTYLMCIMTEAQCRSATCPQCHTPILSLPIDHVRLAIVHDRRVRDQFSLDQTHWKRLESAFRNEFLHKPSPFPPTTTSPLGFRIPCKDFRAALTCARKSFHLPATAMPHDCNFVNYPETLHIRDALLSNLCNDVQMLHVSRESTMGLLLNFATETLQRSTGVRETQDVWTVMPREYRRCLIGWFWRTLVVAYDSVKRGEREMEGLVEDLSLERKGEEDSGVRMGFKPDLEVMGR